MSPPIHPLTSSQGAVFLVNSCQRYFSCGPTCVGQALFRSYGCFFAEFLGDFSLVRLRLLDVNTCFGLRYGPQIFMLRSFSWKRGLQNYFRRTGTSSLLIWVVHAGFTWHTPSRQERKSNNALCILLFVTPSQNLRVMEYSPCVHRMRRLPSP